MWWSNHVCFKSLPNPLLHTRDCSFPRRSTAEGQHTHTCTHTYYIHTEPNWLYRCVETVFWTRTPTLLSPIISLRRCWNRPHCVHCRFKCSQCTGNSTRRCLCSRCRHISFWQIHMISVLHNSKIALPSIQALLPIWNTHSYGRERWMWDLVPLTRICSTISRENQRAVLVLFHTWMQWRDVTIISY